MSFNAFVRGFMPPDDKWKKMKAAWDACVEANVDPPKEVSKFFAPCFDSQPDETGAEVHEDVLTKAGAVREWRDEHRQGYEIDVTKLPPGVKIVRVFWGW